MQLPGYGMHKLDTESRILPEPDTFIQSRAVILDNDDNLSVYLDSGDIDMTPCIPGECMLHDIGEQFVDNDSQELKTFGIQHEILDVLFYHHTLALMKIGCNPIDQCRQIILDSQAAEVIR
jgi:hypothetical protein